MKRRNFVYLSLFLLSYTLLSCGEDYDDNPRRTSVNDFIWQGLNQYYFWLSNSPDLDDNRFSNAQAYQEFLNSYTPPESLFEHLLVDRQTDRFSVIYSDYNKLEQLLAGTLKSNGVDYELRLKNGSTTELFGWVRYIMPNSDASTKNIHRGNIFYAVNGTPLTTLNYKSLLNIPDNYTLNLADYNNGTITPNGISINLNKNNYSENPVYITKTFDVGAKKIGYLMYNGFYSQYEAQLNNAFTYFSSQNITHLIIDLRYNSGGSVDTATRLASMITGQFNTEIFAKQKWNYKIESILGSNSESLLNRFTNQLGNGSTISSLQFDKVYILTSKRTASASELLINGLKPYINVTQIGDVTTGKNVGSITLYDSPNFRKQNINPTHTYAMQPIVLKIANKNNFSEYTNGLMPTVNHIEDLGNLGTLGETSDPLLQSAINYIDTNGKTISQQNPSVLFEYFQDSKSIRPLGNEMYIERQ